MNLYDAIVRLSGSLHNEVERKGITAAEIFILQSLHGDDAVRGIKHVGVTNETQAAIRESLADFYGTGQIESPRSGPDLVRKVLGPKNVPLIDSIEGVEHLSAPVPAKSLTSLTAE